ncbi:hypothetical protein FEZ18_09675 [Oceanihabitans sp. IOP_32]|nr:hypothetical protein FEZ18_09675 [Oceanihabitans sp. IOP_32]
MYSNSLLCVLSLSFSCSEDSVTDEFTNANGNVQEKLITSISITSAQNNLENEKIELSYTQDGKLNTITNGVNTNIFVYNNNNELTDIAGSGINNLSLEELYQSPYDAFEAGDVLNYDDNGNPKTIEFYEEWYEYNYITGNYEYFKEIYTANISYDDAPNPYFFTLQAGGIIDVLDGIELNFSLNPQVPEIVQAKMLFPSNNPSQIVYKNENGETIYTINANYSYDSDNYPTSGTITAVSSGITTEQSTYSVVYEYLN